VAVRARFGRLPRSAPSLTSTIVSLAQEYQRTRDRNIEDAWKNGGQFEGHKVTDSQFIAHWKERLKSVSPDDPMWDYYNNLIYQYNFTIEESKMGQKYAEEKVTDGQMAAFYRKWAAKMPKDSQNYRQLMTQAAKFKAASSARSSGRRSNAAASAYSAAQQKTYNDHEAAYDVTTQLLTKFAVDHDYLSPGDLITATGKPTADGGWGALTNATGENDPSNFAAMLTDIMADPDTRKAMTAYIRRFGDPNFSGTFDDETLAGMANTARNGAMIRANRARKAGDKTGENQAIAATNKYSKSSMVIRASLGSNAEKGFVEQNEAHRAQMDSILAPDSGASPTERQLARTQYRDWLTGDGGEYLIKSFPAGSFDPMSPNYNIYAAGLLGRAKGTVSALDGHPVGLTLKDDLFGFSTKEAGGESDAVKLGTSLTKLDSDMIEVENGTKIVVRVDGSDRVDPMGKHWAIFDRDDKDVVDRELVPFSVPLNGSKTGGEIRYTASEPVQVQMFGAVDPNTGRGTMPLKPTAVSDPNVGSRVEITGPMGQTFVLWGIMQGGTKVWTPNNPFQEVGRGSEGRDEHGNYVVGYSMPTPPRSGAKAPTFDPSAFINKDMIKRNVNGIDSTDGKPWDPMVDKEMGFNSPLAAFAHTSSATAKWVSDMDPTLVQRTEAEFFSKTDNWTPEMKGMAARGVDPKTIVGIESQRLQGQLYVINRDGFTPEDQQRSRTLEAAREEQRSATTGGYGSVTEMTEQAQRNSIAADLAKWGSQPEDLARRTQNLPAGPGGSRAEQWIKKGWTVGDLLSQPGMSVDQANDLAAIISGGAVGKRIAPVGGGPVTGTGKWSGTTVRTPGVTPSNPYGTIAYKSSTAGPAAGPNAASPITAVVPKTVPKVTNNAQANRAQLDELRMANIGDVNTRKFMDYGHGK